MECFIQATPECDFPIPVISFASIEVFTFGEEARCYSGTIDGAGNLTWSASDWTATGWKAHIFNGPTAATAEYKGTLKPTDPTKVIALTSENRWWLKVIATEALYVKIKAE